MNLLELWQFIPWELHQSFVKFFLVLSFSIILLTYVFTIFNRPPLTNFSLFFKEQEFSKNAAPYQTKVFLWGLLSIFILIYLWGMIYDASFAEHADRPMLIAPIFLHSYDPLYIFANTRFYPLSDQYLNVIGKISQNPIAFYSVNVIQFILSICLLLKLLCHYSLKQRISIICGLFLITSIFCCYYEFIFNERNVIFLYLVFLFFAQKFWISHKKSSLIVALIAANTAFYFKETAFLLFSGFAVARMLMLWHQEKWSLRQLLQNLMHYPLECGLMLLSLIYILAFLHYIHFFQGGMGGYYNLRQTPLIIIFAGYMQRDFIFSVFIIFMIYRVTLIIRSKKSMDSTWDAIAVGALLYYSALIYTKMSPTPYYMAPADFVACLYLLTMLGDIFIPLLWLCALASLFYNMTYFKNRSLINSAYEQISVYLEQHYIEKNKPITLYAFLPDDWRDRSLSAYLKMKFPNNSLIVIKTPKPCWVDNHIMLTPQFFAVPCFQSLQIHKGDVVFLSPWGGSGALSATEKTRYLNNPQYQRLFSTSQPFWLKDEQFRGYLLLAKSNMYLTTINPP